MNVAVTPSHTSTRAADGFGRRAFTVDDISKMMETGLIAPEERFELIEGDIVMMSAQHIVHERIKHALTMEFAKAAGSDVYVAVESALQLAADILVVPDLAIVSRAVYQAEPKSFARPRAEDVRLMIEVAATSLAYDRKIKARLYARHGISEYWLIDANKRVTWVHTGPTDEGWTSIVERSPNEALTTAALPGLSMKLIDIS